MLDKIENMEADIALVVTDGFVAGRSNGRNAVLVGAYVASPLIWAVAGAPNSIFSNIEDVVDHCRSGKECRIGISRLGSGSHTMAYYMCNIYGIDIKNIHFEIAQNINGLVNGMLKSFVYIELN